MRIKPVLVALAVIVGAAALMSQVALRDAQASVQAFNVSSTSFDSGTSISVVFQGTDDDTTTIAATGGANPTFHVFSCTVNSTACTTVPADGASLSFASADGDGSDSTADTLSVSMTFTATCDTDATITLTGADAANSQDKTVTCLAASNGGGGGQFVGGFGQVTLSADPNLLPCQGGTSVLTASVFDQVGTTFDDAAFAFSTTAGLLTQTGSQTATLTLGPNQPIATVTASIADPVNKDVKTATVTVSLACGSFSNESGVSVVVTASPNVIECGGTSTITASGRDPNGHVVAGLGFHFATDQGLLVVQPNNANNENGIATLTLKPGMTAATVTVSVGSLLGTVEQTVTVQQFCPGPNINGSVQPGILDLNASSTEVTCGETIFVGASVHDSKAQIVADNTVVNFLATNGQFLNPDGSYQDGANVALNTLSAPTVNGVLNVKYIVGAVQGDVKITAASGDKFGQVTLHATCANPAAATGGATSSSSGGRAACIPIGNNVCITPPNTGDAGLKK